MTTMVDGDTIEHAGKVLATIQKLGGREAMVSYMRHINRPAKRSCAACQLCCTLLPVKEAQLRKPAGQRCEHQCGKGCAIYPFRPGSCQMWSCEWALGLPETNGMQRPDHVHYVVDSALDIVTVRVDDVEETLLVKQVWVDPEWPDAHKDPGLRAMLDETGQPALIRYDSARGFVLLPPSLTGRDEWITLGCEHCDGDGIEPAAPTGELEGEGEDRPCTHCNGG